MKLTPLEIKKQEFRKTMRGYDPDEVNSFLEMVSENYEDVQRELNSFRDNEAVIRKELENYKSVEKTLRTTLHSLQESSQQSRANNEKEGVLIVKEAEIKAAEIIEKAKNKVDRIRDEARLLKSQKESLVKRLKHLLTSHLELIKMLEIEEETVPKKAKSEAPPQQAPGKIKVNGLVQSGNINDKENEPDVGQEIDRIIKNLEKHNSK